MTEYIDRQAALDALAVNADYSKIKKVPAADVAPVVHGRWTAIGADKRGRGATYRCSACNGCYPYACKFCPNCGAKMDLEG